MVRMIYGVRNIHMHCSKNISLICGPYNTGGPPNIASHACVRPVSDLFSRPFVCLSVWTPQNIVVLIVVVNVVIVV